MKKTNKIFCLLSGYDTYIVSHCKNHNNLLFSVGCYFVLQIMIVCFSVYTLLSNFLLNNFIYLAFIASIFISFCFIKILVPLNKLFQKHLKVAVLFLYFFLNFLFVSFLVLPILLNIFNAEIAYQDLINDRHSITFVQNIINKLISFYEIANFEADSKIILFFSLSIYVIIIFVFTAPYFIIFYKRQTIYSIYKKIYERYFQNNR